MFLPKTGEAMLGLPLERQVILLLKYAMDIVTTSMNDLYSPGALATHEPPAYQAPTFFTVGGQQVPSLITPAQLKGHLSLLREFAELKVQVELLANPQSSHLRLFPYLPAEPERKWSWFVGLAVER